MKNAMNNFSTTPPLPSEGEGIKRYYRNAFTLAELLIALAILGVIATFTIPKILDSGTNTEWNAKAKEAASMITGAFQSYKLNNSATANTSVADLTPYMNYVKFDTVSQVDRASSAVAPVPFECSDPTYYCLALHNGAILWYNDTVEYFGDTSTTSAISIRFDPDGYSAGNDIGKSVQFWLYINGRIVTRATIETNTGSDGASSYNPDPTNDPVWFSWSN